MRQQLSVVSILAMAIIMGLAVRQSLAQQGEKPQAPAGSYRLEFTVYEMEDGKTVNSRSYTMTVGGSTLGQVRAGSRVPVEAGEKGALQYLDIGQYIDSRLISERDRSIVLDTTSEISNLVPAQAGSEVPLSNRNPIIRQLKSRGQGEVELGKPTVISSLDDVSSKRRFRLEVLATRIK
jgi:hypothetical protein